MTMDALFTERILWLDRARALEPAVAQWRDAGEQRRHMPDELFQVIRDTGIFRLALPKHLGGEGADLETLMLVMEELSRQDGATGWNVHIALFQSIFFTALPLEGAAEVLAAGPDGVSAGTGAPFGKAVPVAGGYRVSGRWPYASGCHHADWFVAGCMVHARDTADPPVRIGVFVPARDCEIIDTWDTGGLRGTGSHDFQITDVLVPERRTFIMGAFPRTEPGKLSQRGFGALTGVETSVVGLGIARCAIESFKALAKQKTPYTGTTVLANLHPVHEKVGRAEALLRSGRAFLYETARLVEASLSANGEVSDELLAITRLAASQATENAVQATALMYTTGGGSAAYRSSRLDRCLRDIHVAQQHFRLAPDNFEIAGQYFLGFGLQGRR
jgi:alkylation response protein AidB-like acyl-CoA dehydrogenase